MQIESVGAGVNVVVAEHLERAFVVPARIDVGIAKCAHIAIFYIVHAQFHLAGRCEVDVEVDEDVAVVVLLGFFDDGERVFLDGSFVFDVWVLVEEMRVEGHDGVAVVELDERVSCDGIWCGCIVGEDGASGRCDAGIHIEGMTIAAIDAQFAVGKDGSEEFVAIELLLVIGQQLVQVGVEVVLEVLHVAMCHLTI